MSVVGDESGVEQPKDTAAERKPGVEAVDETRSEATGEIKVVSAPAPTAVDTAQPLNVLTSGRSRRQPWALMLLLVTALVSFVVVSQLRGPDRFRERLGTESEGDLARILASLSSESSTLQQELGSLKVDLANLQNSSAADSTQSAEATAQLNALRVLAGTVPVTGPGLQLVITDPGNRVKFDQLVDAVQELRDAGAEALSCNGRRLGVSSYFESRDNRIMLDGVALNSPYTLEAIGPAATMEGGLKIPGGTLDTLRALNGATVELHRSNDLTMAAVESPLTFRVARPVGSNK